MGESPTQEGPGYATDYELLLATLADLFIILEQILQNDRHFMINIFEGW